MKRFACLYMMAFLILVSSGRYALAKNTLLSTDTRNRCVAILVDSAGNGGKTGETAFRAAEILLTNGYTPEIRELITALRRKGDRLTPGECGLLALADRKDPALFQEHMDRLIWMLTSQPDTSTIEVLNVLASLGYDSYSPEIQAIAQNGTPQERILALEVGANSGDSAAGEQLVEHCGDNDASVRTLAIRALIRSNQTELSSYDRLKAISSDKEKQDITILPALFIHAPEENRNDLKASMKSSIGRLKSVFPFATLALAAEGAPDDIPFLEKLLDSDSIETRVEAANALIRIERRDYRGIGVLDWLVIAVYAAAMLGIGVYFSRRQKTSDDYLVGGRAVNPFVSGISLFASYLSTISYLAVAGEVIKHGPLVFLIHIASIVVVYPVTAYFLIPLFMKLPITSAYEIIERPLGKGVRITGSLIFLITRFLWMALLIYLTSKALVVMLNLDNSYILLISIIGGIITVIYSTMGGLRAVVTTDVTQFFILLFGALLTIVIITFKLGGTGAWLPDAWSPSWDKLVFFSLSPYIRLTVVFSALHFLSWWIATAGSDQMAIQRFIATKDVRSARQAFLTAQLGEKILFIILISVGFALFSFYRRQPWLIPDGLDIVSDADYLFPNFIANHLPIGISGLVIAAIFSAAMSSLSSGVNSTAAVFTTDIMPWLTKRDFTDSQRLKLARKSSFFVGVLVVIISAFIGGVPGNITEVTTKTNGLFVCPLFNLFFMALFVPFATPFGTIMGSIYGVAIAVIVAFWDKLTGGPGVTFLWIGPSSLVVSICVSMLLSLLKTRGKSIRYLFGLGLTLLVPALLAIYAVTRL